MILFFFSSIFAFFSDTCLFFPTPPIFLQLFLSSAVWSAFFTPHTCTPVRAVHTFLPIGPYQREGEGGKALGQ